MSHKASEVLLKTLRFHPSGRSRDLSPVFSEEKSCDPFNQGLQRQVVLRLLKGTHTLLDRKKYYTTPWFIGLKHFAIDYYGSCMLCDKGAILDARRPRQSKKAREGLTVHHRHYRNLFSENISKDIGVICKVCHKRHHRKG